MLLCTSQVAGLTAFQSLVAEAQPAPAVPGKAYRQLLCKEEQRQDPEVCGEAVMNCCASTPRRVCMEWLRDCMSLSPTLLPQGVSTWLAYVRGFP